MRKSVIFFFFGRDRESDGFLFDFESELCFLAESKLLFCEESPDRAPN